MVLIEGIVLFVNRNNEVIINRSKVLSIEYKRGEVW